MSIVIGVLTGLLAAYLLLVVALLIARPGKSTLIGVLRLLPDIVRLIRRLAVDPQVPRGVRVRLWLLLGYLLIPIDLIPDFVPVVGYADDAILVNLVLRSVIRRAGPESLTRHWPGTAEGLRTIRALTGLRDPPDNA